MKKLIYISIIILALSCKEKYISPVGSPTTGYLVVEGIVNNGTGNTTIRLTRTTKLGDTTTLLERNAKVTVEGENNVSYSLVERSPGHYSVLNLNLPNTQKYRLRINTSGGKEFLSDFAEVRKTPPIDTLSWKRENDGLQLYVEAHDDKNKTRYYQWEYKETWEFRSTYQSTLKYKIIPCIGDPCPIVTAVYRDSVNFSYDRDIINCWQTDTSTSFELGSTAKLEKDIVYYPLVYIPPKSWRLGVLYSIIIKQYSWTKEGYEFLEKMKKNTEVTGSVFDPQPSELKGNIRNVSNPDEPVLGFFSICNIEERRFWIKNSDLTNWGYRPYCPEFTVANASDELKRYSGEYLPTIPYESGSNGAILKLGVAPNDCVDCTLRGSNKKPAFWP